MANTNTIKNKGPAQVHALDGDVILLRQVDFKRLGPNLTDMLRRTDIRPGEKEGDLPWFLDGYVSVDHPRDYEMAVAVLEATIGYALARTDTGDIIAQFERDQFARASKIASRAKAEIAVEVLLDEDEADDEPMRGRDAE